MKETGETTESVLLRKLVDEALAQRRKKNQLLPLIDESNIESDGGLQSIESLLMRSVRQGEVSLRIHDVCLALLQQVLAEAHATRRLAWQSLLPQLRENGIAVDELERRFARQPDEAKDYAYGIAQRIKKSQKTS